MRNPLPKVPKSNAYRCYQRNLPIYDGRYDVKYPTETTAPPLQLFHPVFGHFLDDIADEKMDIPDETLRAAADFMASASGIYEEPIRQSAILPHLSAALSIGMTQVVNLDRTCPDGAVIATLTDIPETATLLVDEQKRDLGEGADPSIQAGLSMIRFWAQENHRIISENTCCPTFLFASAGPWITVLGAIFTDKVVVLLKSSSRIQRECENSN